MIATLMVWPRCQIDFLIRPPEVFPELLGRGPLLLVPRLARHALGRREEGPPPSALAALGDFVVVELVVVGEHVVGQVIRIG